MAGGGGTYEGGGHTAGFKYGHFITTVCIDGANFSWSSTTVITEFMDTFVAWKSILIILILRAAL